MEPSTIKKDLKNDKIYGMGKTSVSWHKDSGLQDFSSIAVYQTLQSMNNSFNSTNNNSQHKNPWRVALRVADGNSRTPALSIPLPSGSLYYLLDDFNHQHEHAVISGSNSIRYSSTHRVARDGCGSWTYIRDKCDHVLSLNLCKKILITQGNLQTSNMMEDFTTSSQKKQLVKDFRACTQLLTELEFEWILQWHIQGRHHANLHKYWHKPIEIMKSTYRKMNTVISYIIKLLQDSLKVNMNGFVCEDLFDVAIESAEVRQNMTSSWKFRLRDPIFFSLPEHMKPFPCSIIDKYEEVSPSTVRSGVVFMLTLKVGQKRE